MDRGYLDIERLCVLNQARAHLVIHAKRNFKFNRRYSHQVDKASSVQCDQTITLDTFYSVQGCNVAGA